MIRFGIVGAGWRAEFYIRIALLIPESFKLCGVYVRNAERATLLTEKYQIPVFSSLEELLATTPDFVVSCVNKQSICEEIVMLCEKDVPVLSETPIGMNPEETTAFAGKIKPSWRVQVAEQYHLTPRNQAIKALITSGLLGTVNHVRLSCCHDYHAVSLMRFFLDIDQELPEIQNCSLQDTVTQYNSRNGRIAPQEICIPHSIAICKYSNHSAIYDFTYEQYFSEIRSPQITIRGTLGEIVNDTCTYLQGQVPVCFSLHRHGHRNNESLDSMYLDSITGNGNVLYQNPFPNARLSDEEIAIATVLVRLDTYLKTGVGFYSLQDAMLDAETAYYFHHS